MNKKILIIGNSASSYALAKKLSESNEVFVAPGSDTIKEFATCLDIREDSVSELLEFVLENGIDMTIPVSQKTINSEITKIFNKNEQAIFSSTKEACRIIYDKAFAKKLLYKLRIPTPKFGIFEKQNMVIDYIKNIKAPFVLKTNEVSSSIISTSLTTAKPIIDSYFAIKNQKVIIEDYCWGTPFNFYAITDGYKALPITSSISYRHSLDGEGGQLTSGMGACVPNYKLSNDNEYFLMDNVIYPLIEHLEREGNPYIGIIGVNGILSEDGNLQVLGLDNFFQNTDADAILDSIDCNLYKLFESCILGSFSDEIDYISQKDMSYTSITLICRNKENNQNTIYGIENLGEDTLLSYHPTTTKNRYLELEAQSGPVLVLTLAGRTTSSSTQKAYDEIKNINFNGLYYRKDICKPLLEFV